jgi:hypothetical protein
MAPPSRCTIHHNSVTEPTSSIHLLTYKLCHTYFNIPTAMRVPAPILYAQKLAKQVAERSQEYYNETFVKLKPLKTHTYLTAKAPGLYFL